MRRAGLSVVILTVGVYLAGCAYAFENDDVAIYQIVGRKAGRAAETLPWSRRYIYEGSNEGSNEGAKA